MGEMADDAYMDSLTELDLELDYKLGLISDEEAYNLGLIDELGFSFSPYKKKVKTCKHCGKKGLHWKQIGPEWKLVDVQDNLHFCK